MTLLILLTACFNLPHVSEVPDWPSPAAAEPPGPTQDTFVLADAAPADVLLVVEPDPDVVGPLVDDFPWLIEEASRIGVVSSTGGELAWDADPAELLATLDGDGPSAPLDASYAALEDNPDFRRPDADLHVLIATASDDASLLPVAEWVDWMAAVGPAQVGVLAPDTATWAEVRAAFPGPATVEDFGLAVAGARMEFFLSRVPRSGTLELEVLLEGGALFWFEEGEDYVYNAVRNSAVFLEYAPQAGSTVVVRYDEV